MSAEERSIAALLYGVGKQAAGGTRTTLPLKKQTGAQTWAPVI